MAYGTNPYTPTSGSHQVSGGEQTLNFIISATNMATPGIAAVSAGFANLTAVGMRASSSITEAVSTTSAGFLAIGGAAALGLAYATSQASGFERQMKNVQAVSDLNNSELANLSDTVKQLAMQYGIGATEIASSMQTIGRAGIKDATEQTAVFQNALKMAKIEGMELTEAIEGIVTQVNLWGGDLSNVEEYNDLVERITVALTHASQISPTDVSDLLQGAQYVGGIAKESGWDEEETYGTLAYMASKGVSGSTAGVALRGLISKTAMQQPSFQKAMASIGLNAGDLWTDGGESIKDPVSLLRTILDQPQYKAMTTQEQMGLWTQLAQQKTSQQILKLKPDELEDFLGKMREQFDLDQKVKIAMDSVSEQWNRLKSTIEVGLINIGETFLPILKLGVDGLQTIFELVVNNKIAMAGIGVILAGLAGAGGLVLIRWLGGAFKYLYDTVILTKGGLTNIAGQLFGTQSASEGAAAGQTAFATQTGAATEALQLENMELDAAITKYAELSLAGQRGLGAGPMMLSGGVSKGAATIEGGWLTAAQSYTGKNFAGSNASVIAGQQAAIKSKLFSDASFLQQLGARQSTGLWQKEMDTANKTLKELKNSNIESRIAWNAAGASELKQWNSANIKVQQLNKELKILKQTEKEIVLGQTLLNATPMAPVSGGGTAVAKTGLLARLKSMFSMSPSNSLLIKGGLVGEEAAASAMTSGSRAAAVGGSTLAGLGGGMTSATSASSGLTASIVSLGLSMTTLLPILALLAVAIAAVALWWKSYSYDLEQITKEHEAAAAKVDELKGKIDDLGESDDVLAEHTQKWKDYNDELATALNYAQLLAEKEAAKKSEVPWQYGVFGESSPLQSAEEGPAGLSALSTSPLNWLFGAGGAAIFGGGSLDAMLAGGLNYQSYGLSEDQLQTTTSFLQDTWETVADYSKQIAALDAKRYSMSEDEYQRQRRLIYQNSKMGRAGYKTKEEADDAANIYKNERIRQKAWDRLWNYTGLVFIRLAQLIYNTLKIAGSIFDVFAGKTRNTGNAAAGAANNTATLGSSLHTSAIIMQILTEAVVNAAVQVYNFAKILENIAVVLGNTATRLSKHPENAPAILKQMTDEISAGWNHGMMTSAQMFGDLSTEVGSDLFAEGYGGAGEDTSGTGSGSDGSGSSGGKIKAGYNIDFVLCSKKTLPPLDPNLFKRRPTIALTQKQFAIDNLNVNTRDTPDAIQAGVKKVIIDVGNSDQV